MIDIATWAGASIGRRDHQEDWHAVLPAGDGGTLLVIADGMGGHAAGEVASRIAGEAFVSRVLGSDAREAALMAALTAANAAIADAVSGNSEYEGMGTTLVAALVDREGLRWASVGDSLLLLIRNGQVSRLNADHSLGAYVDAQIASGAMSAEDGARLGARNGLLSALAGDEVEMAEIVGAPLPLEPGDIVLAASDGLLTLSIDRIGLLRASASTLSDLGEALLAAVEAADDAAQDNTSVVLARIG